MFLDEVLDITCEGIPAAETLCNYLGWSVYIFLKVPLVYSWLFFVNLLSSLAFTADMLPIIGNTFPSTDLPTDIFV